ncbi:MAG: chromosome segregation protein SMC [Slackia sp.]|nr:chromosome segregation protein SMC [Slackia sp.]
MHLKSLVLKGFKSFADRCVISLEPGITAVVGPNGSGKSNISDAVLWVLGERNAKNLRGQAMEDVIFAGSSARKSVGVAEVDLVLDNSDGTLPVEFGEVSLTRRMYRSGESEYLINGAPARRMDFMDILHDTGLGTGTHSIIGQGNLDAILASRPQDRRALIEEAAGVLKHKQRKERSERKLSAMDAHLARVKDVAAEVERQLKPLARKAARAEAYRDISKELSEIELALAVDDLRVLQKRWDEVGLREKEAAAGIDVARLHAEEAEKKLEKLQALLQEKGLYVGDLTAQRGRFHMVLERLESNDMLLSEKARGIASRLAAARDTYEGSSRRIVRFEEAASSLKEKLDDEIARRDALALQIDELAGECGKAVEERARFDAQLSEAQVQLRLCERDMDKAMARRSELQDGQAARFSAKELLEAKKEQTIAELASAKEDYGRRCKEADDEAAAAADLLRKSKASAESLEAAGDEAAAARAAGNEARTSLQRCEGRIAALKEALRGLGERNAAASWVCSHAREFDEGAFPVSSRIKAPQKLEALVEQLLGDDLASLCAVDAQHACAIAKGLTESGCDGEASVLFAARSPLSKGGSEANRLLNMLEYPEELASAMEALLGDVVLVDSFYEAIRCAAEGDRRLRFATDDGIVVRPGAKVSLGWGMQADEGLLSRERELACQQELRERAAAELESAEARIDECERGLEVLRSESLVLSQALAQREGASKSAQAERERAARRVGSLEASLEAISAELAVALEKLAGVEPEMEKLEATIGECKARRAGLDDRRACAASEREAAFDKERHLQARLSEAKLEHATAAERVKSLTREHRERCGEADRAQKAQKRAKAEIHVLETAERRVAPLHETLSSLKECARAKVDDLAGKAALVQSSSQELSATIEQARTASREAQERLDAARSLLNDVRVEKGRLEVQVEAAVSAIVNERGVPLETALGIAAPENREAAEEEAYRLSRRLKSIGTIDSSAAGEYEAMKERYDFLAAQVEDVEAARRALRRIVAAIDARMQEQFDVTFDRVNENFGRIFAQLFPGGSGSLELVDLDGEGQLGVEVHAQPRGKRIAKMTLMSGGEKSLVAIALLFAVYSIRHTPFYILDEVEAALDDSNLRRLLAYLETLRHETQLIMITHQRRTMEMSDVLYGVSMQADGVTKVVSQRLDRSQQSGR